VRWEFLDKMQQMLCFFIKGEGDSALGISAVVEKKRLLKARPRKE